jgi:two-component system LytT family response regulator
MTEALRTLIVDDEPIARDLLRTLLARQTGVEVIGECADGPAALAAIESVPTDVVLLDVQMPGMSGLDVAARLDGAARPAIVFVTAHEEHAVSAFELQSIDYLLKPVDPERLAQALDRCRRTQVGLPRDRLVVRYGDRRIPLRWEDVVWVESAGNYVTIHVPGEEYLLRTSLAALSDRLRGRGFARIHRRTLVNVSRITSIQPAGHGDFRVLVPGGQVLTMSRRYRAELEALFGDLG